MHDKLQDSCLHERASKLLMSQRFMFFTHFDTKIDHPSVGPQALPSHPIIAPQDWKQRHAVSGSFDRSIIAWDLDAGEAW